MPVFLSNPLTLSVLPRVFSNGSEAGSLQGDAWTPGRDAQGVVNQVSWDLVPRGRWITVAGTRMDTLDARIKAAMPQWRELANWDSYAHSWSSLAPDLPRGRLFFSGGGHGDGSNNGLYSFNLYRMAWDIEMMPSDPSLWSDSYKNLRNWGWCTESFIQTQAKIAAGTLSPINDWGLDEIFWDNSMNAGGASLGKMTAKHTYHSYVYVPAEDSVMFLHRRLWKISLASDSVTYKRLINDNPQTPLDTEHGLTIYDEVRNELLASSAGSSGITNSVRYNLATNTWTLNPTQYNPPWKIWDNVSNTRVGRNITVLVPPRSTGGVGGKAWIYNLDSRSVTSSSDGFKFGGGLSPASFAADNAYYDGTALEYIPPLNRYWMWTLMANNEMQALTVDPGTTPWTISPTTFSGDVPVPGKNMLRKMFWVEAMNAVWQYDRGTRDWYVYKF